MESLYTAARLYRFSDHLRTKQHFFLLQKCAFSVWRYAVAVRSALLPVGEKRTDSVTAGTDTMPGCVQHDGIAVPHGSKGTDHPAIQHGGSADQYHSAQRARASYERRTDGCCGESECRGARIKKDSFKNPRFSTKLNRGLFDDAWRKNRSRFCTANFAVQKRDKGH